MNLWTFKSQPNAHECGTILEISLHISVGGNPLYRVSLWVFYAPPTGAGSLNNLG